MKVASHLLVGGPADGRLMQFMPGPWLHFVPEAINPSDSEVNHDWCDASCALYKRGEERLAGGFFYNYVES